MLLIVLWSILPGMSNCSAFGCTNCSEKKNLPNPWRKMGQDP